MTDNATPLSGYDLAWEWMHAPMDQRLNVAEGWKAPDGCSWAWGLTVMDWDYHMAYLLEVRTHDRTSDFLDVYQKHAPGNYPDHDLKVEWFNHPHTFPHVPGSAERFGEQDAVEWFVDWCYKLRRSEWF